jgi:hypothetical protein
MEMVQTVAVRNDIIKKAWDWFGSPSVGINPVAGSESSLLGQCYPNPVTGIATIQLNGINSDMVIEVVDIAGKVQMTVPVHQGSITVNIDAGSLSDGLYLYRLVSGGKVIEVHKMQVIK